MAAIARRTYADLLAENAELREEIAALRGEERDDDLGARLSDARGLTRQQSRLMLALHARRGRVVAFWRLHEIVALSENAGPALLRAQIYLIRRKLGRDVISMERARGYRLTERGLALIDVALEGGSPTRRARTGSKPELQGVVA